MKVIDIFVYNTILCLYILNQLKLAVNKRQVIVESSLVIVQTALARTQLRIALDKPINLVLAHLLPATLLEQSVGYISHVVFPIGQSSLSLHYSTHSNSLLFQFSQAPCQWLLIALRALSSLLTLNYCLQDAIGNSSALFTLNLFRIKISNIKKQICFSISF